VFVEGAVNGRLIFYMFRTIQCSKWTVLGQLRRQHK
jgi:hypothetical protein